MTANTVESGQGVGVMVAFDEKTTSPLEEDETARTESPEEPKKPPMNGVTEGVNSRDKTPGVETSSGDVENTSRTSSQAQEGATRRAGRRKVEVDGLLGGMDASQLLRLERTTRSRGDSGTKQTDEEILENEGVVESSMFKQVKFGNGTAIAQSGLTDADNPAEASRALAAVMEVYGNQKEVVGQAADFPGAIGMGSKNLCHICEKPETSKHTIVCDKCQRGYHLSCVNLKPKRATDIENEHWQCGSCGPELGWEYWPLGKVTPQHDRKQADSKRAESTSHISNVVEHRPGPPPVMDAATEVGGTGTQPVTTSTTRKEDDNGRPRVSGNLWLRTREQEVVVSLPGGSALAVKRGPGRPRKDPNAVTEKKPLKTEKLLRDQTVMDLGVRDNVPRGEQPAMILESNISASATMPQSISGGATDILTTANEREIHEDSAHDGAHSDSAHDGAHNDKHDPESMLEDLRQFIAGMDGRLEKGWEVIRKRRPSNPQLIEKIFISPNKQKFRSRLAVARFLGLSHSSQRESRLSAEPAAQRLETSVPAGNLSHEGYRSGTEMLEPQEVVEIQREEKSPVVVKESRLLPPAGELLTRRLPVELVGDTIQVWEFLCRFSDFLELKSPLTYEELETGLVDIGPPATEDSPCKPDGTGTFPEKVSGLEQRTPENAESENLPGSSTVQENKNLARSPMELPVGEVALQERTVACADGTLNDNFVMMSKTHVTLLKLLLDDLQLRITGNPIASKPEKPEELKKKTGPKPQVVIPEYLSDLPMNEVTWPELMRRYLVTLIEAEKYGDLAELTANERKWLLRCLQGDGGIPCGALYTVVGVESDAQVLAEAEKELSIRLQKAGQMKEEAGSPDDGDTLPEWVEALRPVAKMATNVGSRIRIKVKEALELDPPEWARELLEWSISKEVFKSNASGPTKKAVVEVLNHFDVTPACESPTTKTKPKKSAPSVDQLMQRCRVVLRTVADADKTDTFSILIDGPEGHGSRKLRGMVARPLDFRTIDARLAAGAYGGSIDAFAEDVRQIWRNVESLQKGGEVMELASHLSQMFEDLLQKQVINFMSGVVEVKPKEPKAAVPQVTEEGAGPVDAPLTRSATAEKPENKLQTAPWQDSETCRVCGVDEDYDSIMLCDRCDAEYHTYCLNPPLEEVPDGNWFCPECVALDKGYSNKPTGKDVEGGEPESLEGEEGQEDRGADETGQRKESKEALGESSAQRLLKQVDSKEYWHLGLSDRVEMLKFLCNELLKTPQFRTHLEKTLDVASDLQQQLSDLYAQRQEADAADQGKKKEAPEPLKTRSQIARAAEASGVDTVSSRLRHHSSGVLGAEDIGAGFPRTLNFDADGKEYENSVEISKTVKVLPDLAKEGNHDVPVNTVIHEDHDSKKRRNEEVLEGESKRAKVQEFSEGGEAQVENAAVTLPSEQTEDVGRAKVLTASELLEGQTVAEVVEGETPDAGSKIIAADEEARGPGRRMSLRTTGLSSEPPAPSGPIVKIGVAADGLPPRTPKRKIEPTSSSETLKKARTDGTGQAAPALGEVIDDPHGGEALSDHKSQGPAIHTRSMGAEPSNELSKLDAEILKVELKLYNTSVRRDHLGTDDLGRDYWALSGSNQAPMLVVSECDLTGGADYEVAEESIFTYEEQCGSGKLDGEILQSDNTFDTSKETKPRWWAYRTEAAIDSLVAWLNSRHKLERALKSSIAHWRETVFARFHDVLHESKQELPNKSSSENGTGESLKKERTPTRFPTLKATSFIHMRYGSSSFSDRAVHKKSVMPMEGKVIRCSCLEPLWKYKWHCHACHETYESLAELESHKNSCPCAVFPHSSSQKQKGSGKVKNNLTPVKGKKNLTPLKGKKKGKPETSKTDGARRALDREDTSLHACEENSWNPQDPTEPPTLLNPPGLLDRSSLFRSKRQTSSYIPDDGGLDDDPYALEEEPVEDAFFLSDFQDGIPGTDEVETEENSLMGFGSYSQLLQDDEWEANLRPERSSELKRKKQGSGKKQGSKQPPTPGSSELALANFDYASLPMTFSTPDSTRDRINQIGFIADQGPTFAPGLRYGPAFDPSLNLHSDASESPTDAVEFPGSSSQNGSPAEEFHAKEFAQEGGIVDDSLLWYDAHISGAVPPDVAFVPDTEPVMQPEFEWGELVGLPKMEYAEERAPEVTSVNDHVKPEAEGPSANDTPSVNASSGEVEGASDAVNAVNGGGEKSQQPVCTLNATGEVEGLFSIDEAQPTSNIEPASNSAPESVPEALPAQDAQPASDARPAQDAPPASEATLPAQDAQPASAAAEVKAVVPSLVPSLKKQSKKFAAPESSLRPLVGEQFGILTGLKMRLLDMEAALGSDAVVPPKSAPSRRRAWRSLVKSAQCIYEMTKALIILEQMVRADCLKRTWCYWSCLSLAARSATLSTLALRIFSLDDAITYKKDKVITEEVLRPSTLRKSHQQQQQQQHHHKKKIQVPVPLPSSKKKKANNKTS